MTRRSHQSPKDAIPPVMRGVKATMIGLKDVIGGLGAVSDRLTAALEGLKGAYTKLAVASESTDTAMGLSGLPDCGARLVAVCLRMVWAKAALDEGFEGMWEPWGSLRVALQDMTSTLARYTEFLLEADKDPSEAQEGHPGPQNDHEVAQSPKMDSRGNLEAYRGNQEPACTPERTEPPRKATLWGLGVLLRRPHGTVNPPYRASVVGPRCESTSFWVKLVDFCILVREEGFEPSHHQVTVFKTVASALPPLSGEKPHCILSVMQ